MFRVEIYNGYHLIFASNIQLYNLTTAVTELKRDFPNYTRIEITHRK